MPAAKHPTRLLRVPATVLAVAGLMLTACSGGSGHKAAASSPGASTSSSVAGSAAPSASSTSVDLTSYYKQKITWKSCGVAGFDCGTMTVPLDYAHPVAADDIKLAVARKKATGKGKKLGSLLVNPGGPGGSAIDYLQYAALGYPSEVTSRYDMVAVDPRGVARSEPVECLTDKQMDTYTAVDTTPDNTAEIKALTAADRTFDAACNRRSGKLLGHVSTVDSARDMDVLRGILGDPKLNYVGKSYGTFLGATYAGLFPKNVGHVVLDGAMDPSISSLESSRTQAGGFEVAFDAFAKDCVARADCPLGTKSVAVAGKRLTALFKSLDAHPLKTGTPARPLTEALGTTGVISAMYDQSAWPSLRDALTDATKGEGDALLKLSDSYYERDDSGKYSNLMYANAAVNCLDLPPAFKSPAEVEKALPSFRKASPLFGTTLAWSSLGCAYWPVAATGHAAKITANGAGPILVVGTTRDPATPYAWAQSLASQLSSGHLLTYNGDGHTAYARGSACIDSAVNAYLLAGTVPPAGKKCS
ncbi:Pimeloyl-ACP methyl ester carboxylesterase [Actinacidiphila yanglinensis]|uniref:Pimeloyl-ACP methyl ester carboxylesterase n=1 Tax=Actinacidiphila yanglinensis TaxID=310779 RepID=A0A1H5YUB9_9ACTN|nr:alpha/beta hydrolase [Actinacidiphila yanglinensis]SEG27751.1 Pimeloyl-ACP methyl ester carboxylesterase [Actinacidiphila yanglinensis]